MWKDLGNGLILRCLEESDRESLLEHVKNVYDASLVGGSVVLLTEQLLDHYPGFALQDNFVVVDTTQNNKIIAWLCLLRKTCIFEGIELSYGQMDMVGTQKEYRNRGLMHQLSKALDERAAEYDLPFLVILGIPYFYKKLGYEYAITLEESVRIPPERIPPLQEDTDKAFCIEKVENSTTFKAYLAVRAKRNAYLDLYQQIPISSLKFYSPYKLEESDEVRHFYLVKKKGEIIGNFYLVMRFGHLRIRELYIEDIAAIPGILQYASELATHYKLPLTIAKPAQEALIPYLEEIAGTKLSEPYAWYVKIPSVIKFLEHITAILETRLEQSSYQGLDACIRINNYKAGIKLTFQKGKLIDLTELSRLEIQNRTQPIDLHIPPNYFTQLLLGYRTLEELEAITFDVICAGKTNHLLNTLFPKVKASLTPTI